MEHDSPSLLFTLATENLTTPTPAGDEGSGVCYLASTTWGAGVGEALSALLPAFCSVPSRRQTAVLRMVSSCHSASSATPDEARGT